MSRGPLPLYVDPFRLCDADARLAGRLPAERLERIREFSLGQTEGVDVDLRFHRDADGRNRITGTVDTVLHTQCERCLEPLALPVHADVALVAIRAGAAVPETAEDVNIVEVEEERLPLLGFVEEEVLLAMPEYPVHTQCDMVGYDRGADVVEEKPASKVNPFAALASLKQKDQ